MSMKLWNYDIYLNTLEDGSLVGTSGDIDFKSFEEAQKDAASYIQNGLCEEYNTNEENFIIKCYSFEVE